MTAKVYVIYENEEWIDGISTLLKEEGIPFELWNLKDGLIDLNSVPPEGIFYSRMSASAHTRNHAYAPELTAALFDWLDFHGRRVVNGTKALTLELSKVKQQLALEKLGIETPKTVVAQGKSSIVKAAKKLNQFPYITKHNRAGKGLGVRLFQSIDELSEYVKSDEFEEPVDGITLIQEYIDSPTDEITRCEFVNGKFLYAVTVDTSEGFELCPADHCSLESPEVKPKFVIQESFKEPIIEKYEAFLEANEIEIAGIEFIKNAEGKTYTYDVNTNTNYNTSAEAVVGANGLQAVAAFLKGQLEKEALQHN